ncbi:MAG: hypothetical protein KDA44_13360 [Planctomycetales bacterium]|nr:hypothetical protein [Planctomycetales bacterium]
MTALITFAFRTVPLAAVLIVATSRGACAQDDVADVPDKTYRIADSSKLLYVQIGPPADAQPPADGYKLLLVLPGGDGSRDFLPFVKRISKYALPEGYIVAELIAPQWSKRQQAVWPTEKKPEQGMKMSTEKFMTAVVADVASRHKLDRRHVFALAWSSGGPAVYAASLTEKTPITATMPAMSIFYPGMFPPLENARGHAYFLLHSPQDTVCKYALAERAVRDLTAAGATVKLLDYEGGHGWRGDVFGNIRAGVAWMEEQTADSNGPAAAAAQ